MRFPREPRPDEFNGRLPSLLRGSWDDGSEPERSALPAPEQNETALAAWIATSLLGVALGLGLAKYSQAWAQDLLHPGAVWGAMVVLASVAIALLASVRYMARGAGLVTARRASRALATLSMVLVTGLAWVALNIIWLGGWELPAGHP